MAAGVSARAGAVARAAFPLLLAGLLLVQALLVVLLIIQIWPAVAGAARQAAAAATTPGVVRAAPAATPVRLVWAADWTPDAETLYLVIVILFGALGASVHTLTSLTTFYGNRTFRHSWALWYLIRMPVGMAVALLFYFLIRGGFLSVNATIQEINPYGIGALAGLSGMFSKQATDKLEEVFVTMFRTMSGGDAERRDKATHPALTIGRVEPAAVPVGAAGRQLRLYGSGFVPGLALLVRNAPHPVTVVSGTELVTALEPADVAEAARLLFAIRREDGAGEEVIVGVMVRVHPQVESATVIAYPGAGAGLRMTGAGFHPAARASIAGMERDVVDVRPDVLEVRLTDRDVAERHTRTLVVENPGPAGGAAEPVSLADATGWS
jgi:hypothetical protein